MGSGILLLYTVMLTTNSLILFVVSELQGKTPLSQMGRNVTKSFVCRPNYKKNLKTQATTSNASTEDGHIATTNDIISAVGKSVTTADDPSTTAGNPETTTKDPTTTADNSETTTKEPGTTDGKSGTTGKEQVTTERVCDAGWVTWHGHCYYFTEVHHTWYQARDKCTVDLSAVLVTIESQEENDFLLSETENLSGHFWTGLHDTQNEGVWLWGDGTALEAFTNWKGSHDDEDKDCMKIKHDTAAWSDESCDHNAGLICEH